MPVNARVEDPYARIEALEAENERLRDQITVLEDALRAPGFVPPPQLGLTGSQAVLLGRLLLGALCTKPTLMHTLYGAQGVDLGPDIKIVGVFLCKLRAKLKPYDIQIATVWGRGYQMPAESIAKFRERWPGNLDGSAPLG